MMNDVDIRMIKHGLIMVDVHICIIKYDIWYMIYDISYMIYDYDYDDIYIYVNDHVHVIVVI